MKLLLLLLLAVSPMFAQDTHTAATQDDPRGWDYKAPEKSHNFFWNKINTPTFIAQAGGAFWMAREINGNASTFSAPSEWHRYLPNAYRESFGIMVAADGIAYGFHKAHFRGHKWMERGVMWAAAGAFYITAERYLKAYNKADCIDGATAFCGK